ncbi:MAG: CBS domain-containing protein [Gemmatimonadetes bacterium]|nr:CBS domain-containing protein [Gemmatimonadota bacterium]
MKARDVMTAHPSVITPDEPIHRAAELMRDRRVGMLPVIDNLQSRRLQGVLTDRDIVVRCVATGRGMDAAVREHMTARHLTTVRLDEEVHDVAHKMRRDHVRRIPVLSDDNRVVGVVAVVDLATRLRPAEPTLVEGIERDAEVPADVRA